MARYLIRLINYSYHTRQLNPKRIYSKTQAHHAPKQQHEPVLLAHEPPRARAALHILKHHVQAPSLLQRQDAQAREAER